jgi:transposase
VDLGGAGKLRDRATGKERQAYCFVMTLSYSRHQYVELVFDQKHVLSNVEGEASRC